MSSNLQVIVDERQLTFQGEWNDGGAIPEFNGTTRYTHTQGSTATFRFSGTSVNVYATITAGTRTMDFTVDSGSAHGSYTTPASLNGAMHHQPIWTSPSLSDGDHTLVITYQTTEAASATEGIFLDYLTYTPSQNTRPPAPVTYLIDSSDSRIAYNPDWTTDSSEAYIQLSAQRSGRQGAQLTLNFHGTQARLFGDVTKRPGQASETSITIDGGQSSGLASGVIVDPNQYTVGQQLFGSPTLSEGNHTLKLTLKGDDPLFVDYFLVDSGDPPSAFSSVTPATNPPTIGATSSSPTPSQPATTTDHSQQTLQASSKASIDHKGAGIIAGSVVAALIVAALIIGGTIWFLRRQRRQAPQQDLSSSSSIAYPSPRYPVFAEPLTQSSPEMAPMRYHDAGSNVSYERQTSPPLPTYTGYHY